MNSVSGEIFQNCNSIPGHFTFEYHMNNRRSKEQDVKTWIKTVKSIDLAFEMQLLHFKQTYRHTPSITVETYVAENFGCNRVKKGKNKDNGCWLCREGFFILPYNELAIAQGPKIHQKKEL